jgi:glycosyltransferase involved in cell wall biosynthesis
MIIEFAMAVLVLGYFGRLTDQIDGQTIKTRSVYDLIKLNLYNDAVYMFDTQILAVRKWQFFRLFYLLYKVKKVVYIPAHNNLYYFSPVLSLLSYALRFDVIHVVVGGWLDEFLLEHPFYVFFVRRFRAILVENSLTYESLKFTFGFKNVGLLHNFRIMEGICNDRKKSLNTSFVVVFAARVSKMKGIDVYFDIASFFASCRPELNVKFLILGPISDVDSVFIYEKLQQSSNVDYLGVVGQADIFNLLEICDVTILPTKYFTEGFPGTILDSYLSGIPVVVSKWIHSEEFVDNGRTGFIVPFDSDFSAYSDLLEFLYFNPKYLEEIKKNVIEKSKVYSSEKAWEILRIYL